MKSVASPGSVQLTKLKKKKLYKIVNFKLHRG